VQKIFLPHVTYPSAYVINSDPSSKPGEHWIAVYFDKNIKAEYFDSYGLSPDMLDFTDFMNANSISWVYNKKTLQSLFYKYVELLCVFYFISLSWFIYALYYFSFEEQSYRDAFHPCSRDSSGD